MNSAQLNELQTFFSLIKITLNLVPFLERRHTLFLLMIGVWAMQELRAHKGAECGWDSR